MSSFNNYKAFTKKVWWLAMLFTSTLSFFEVPLYLSEIISMDFISLPFIFLFLEIQILFFFMVGSLPTYWIFKLISEFFFKKPISDLMLRIELLIWIIPVFTLNLFAINWFFELVSDNWQFISKFTLFYICLFCFILSFKIERKKEFIKTISRGDILDDDLDFKK